MNRPSPITDDPSPITDFADRSALLDRRSPRAAEYREKVAELERAERHARFLVIIAALALPILAWSSASLRDELADAQAELAVVSVVLAAKNVAEKAWECRDVKAYKGNVRTCIRTASRM
jgi:hypothetical protein